MLRESYGLNQLVLYSMTESLKRRWKLARLSRRAAVDPERASANCARATVRVAAVPSSCDDSVVEIVDASTAAVEFGGSGVRVCACVAECS